MSIHDTIKHDREVYRENPSVVAKFRNYSKGLTENALTELQKKALEGILGNDFSDNICHQIISEARDRIKFLRWECPNAQVSEYLDSLYKLSKIQNRQSGIHYASLRDGNHVVALAWSNVKKRILIYREPWWDGVSGVFISYDEEDNPIYAVKEWGESEGVIVRAGDPERSIQIVRRNIWFEDRLERWVSRDAGTTWEEYLLPEDAGIWPTAWVKINGEPLHIPYVNFANAGREGEEVLTYGFSELDGGILAFQDQINDLHLQLLIACRMTAFQMTTASGIPDPSEIGMKVGPGQFLWSKNPEARFGYLPAGDTAALINTLNSKKTAAARISRTAEFVITGDWPSGEALIQAQRPQIGKAIQQIERFIDCYNAIAHKAVEIRNRFSGEEPLPEDVETAPINSLFESPERYDLLSKATILAQIKDELSPEERLRFLGYREEDVERIIEEKEADAERAAERATRLFETGRGPGTELPGRGPNASDEEDDTEE